jgi:acyl phosphate:glycerol-3-phosphate acyltransferase
MFYLLIGAFAYLLGAIPLAYLVVRLITGKNILDYGTGNVGTMNTHRATNSKILTLMVLCGDLLKGYLAWYGAVWLANLQNLSIDQAILLAGFFLILGHNYSVFLKFKGGKGLAAGAGFLFGLSPILDVVWIVSFFLVTGISKYMVLGQMMASILIMIYAVITGEQYLWTVLAMGTLVVIKHAPRMQNILNGTEPKMYYKIRK